MAKLKLLPLSYYFELHDLLTLLTLLGGNYNINLPIKLNECAVNTRQNELIAIDKTRTKKADENFWIRSSKLLNIIIKRANIEIKQIDKQYLTKVYWNYFENCYSEVNSFSWTLLCNCGSCNAIQKVVNSTPQWWVQTLVHTSQKPKLSLSLSLSLSLFPLVCNDLTNQYFGKLHRLLWAKEGSFPL